MRRKVAPVTALLVGVLALLALSLACSSAPVATAMPAATPRAAVAPTQAPATQPTVAVATSAATPTLPTPTPTRVLPTATPAAIGQPVYGGTLTTALDYDSPTMDPAESTGGVSSVIGYTIFDKLVELGPNGQVVPVLAQSWDISADGKSITFHLVKGVTFTDGTPLNAQAVKYNLDRIKDPKVLSPSELDFALVQSVTTPDDNTVVVTLTKPWRPLLASFTAFDSEMASPTAIQKDNSYIFAGNYGSFGKNPVGSGPFEFVSWKPEQSIVVKKNPNYWQAGKPYLDEIQLSIVADLTTATAMVRTGEVDVVDFLQASDIPPLENLPKVKIFTVTGARSWGLQFNLKTAPYNNLDLRQAFSYALDRQQILKTGFGGFGTVAYTFISSGWASNPDLKPINYDPQQAKAKLAAAGYPNGISMTLWTPDTAFFITLTQILQAELKAVNINTQIVEVPAVDHWSETVSGRVKIFISKWSESPDPQINLQNLFQTGGGYSSIWGNSDPQLDKLLTQAGGTYDTAQAKMLYDQAQTIIANDDVYYISYVWADVFTALNVRVHGYVRPPDLDSRLRDVWLEQ